MTDSPVKSFENERERRSSAALPPVTPPRDVHRVHAHARSLTPISASSVIVPDNYVGTVNKHFTPVMSSDFEAIVMADLSAATPHPAEIRDDHATQRLAGSTVAFAEAIITSKTAQEAEDAAVLKPAGARREVEAAT